MKFLLLKFPQLLICDIFLHQIDQFSSVFLVFLKMLNSFLSHLRLGRSSWVGWEQHFGRDCIEDEQDSKNAEEYYFEDQVAILD